MSVATVLVIEHQGDAGLGLFGEQLAARGIATDVVGPDAGGTVPTSLDGFDGLIVLGGSMGPTDDDRAPWLPATRALLAEGVDRGLPTLGICLGAQLLATATGGHVRTMPGGPEVGLCAIAFAESAEGDALFDSFAARVPTALQWHWLEADALPDGAHVLASSEACANQVFRIGERAWGVQFHPEALGDTARGWADDGVDDLAELGLDGDQLVGTVRDAEPLLRDTWARVADRFAELVAQPITELSRAPRRA